MAPARATTQWRDHADVCCYLGYGSDDSDECQDNSNQQLDENNGLDEDLLLGEDHFHVGHGHIMEGLDHHVAHGHAL